MLNFSKLQYLLEINELYQWLATTALCAIICAFVEIFLFINLFQIKVEKSKKINVFILDSIIGFIIYVIFKPPFHRAFETLAKRIQAPAHGDSVNNTLWYYERSRGKYDQEQFKFTKKSEKENFVKKYPKNQVIKKEY